MAKQPSVGPFTAITAGIGHTCGLNTDGNAVCWGSDSNGQSSLRGLFTMRQALCTPAG